ncbi:MAG TPA: T9SS type A sorting domain-containing protein [Bacteroidia bacterium]|nr:T9SS type A sorting domain-containing protein [Bacteroidia bacterium]
MMNRILLFVFVFISSGQSFAQCLDPYYPRIYQTYVERDISYGSDTAYNHTVANLQMNIWKPIGDNNTSRPIILWIHGGGFFTGNKNDMDVIAQAYAERGYVSATMSYRLGFYGNLFFGAPFTFDSSEVIRAAYRAVQDAHGAMRFLKARTAIDSSNINLAFVGGASAGSITAMHFTFVDKQSEAPINGGAISDVTTLFGNVQRSDLGSIFGRLNLNGQSSNVLAAVNLFGALLDTSFIESNTDPALFSYHQTGDGTVGCGYLPGLWNQPMNVSQNYPHLFGSCVINDRMNNLGYSSQHYQALLYNGNVHGIHDDVLIDTLVARFLSDIICENISGTNTADLPAVHVYPNPAKGQININIPGKTFSCSMFDVQGRNIIPSTPLLHDYTTLNITGVSKGMYLLNIITDKQLISKRIIIE